MTTIESAAEVFRRRSRTPLERLQHLLHRHPTISPLAVLAVAVLLAGCANDRFLQPSNLSLVLQQVAIIGALAVGQTLIVLTAGIDLSVGAVMIFTALVMGELAGPLGVPAAIALAIGLAVGAGAGLLNGLLVAKVNLPPFIVTLGTLNVFTAVALLISGGRSIPGSELGSLLTWTSTSFAVGPFQLTTGVALVLLMYLVIGFALTQTAWGRHVYAVGNDAAAARLSGIRTRRLLLSVYVTAGVVFALSAWVLIGRVGAATPNAAVDANLDSITAVVIGGTSLFGGRGRLLGSLLGALIVGVFRNGLALARVDVLYQTLAIGILIIVAVSLDQWIRRTGKTA
ncbi:ABC transporter permease [Sphaerisporangium viridialbum]|uniref:ABC transporter permease n=1 Tax=Sphaerisporangium viridialbum TaxID=46189 RepID=UPI003C707299